MSETEPMRQVLAAIDAAESDFRRLTAVHGASALDWPTEREHARRAFAASNDLQGCDPGSITDAMLGVGAAGITVSPVEGLSHFAGTNRNVAPYGAAKRFVKEAGLKINYQGLISRAVESGAVNAIRADVVREHDVFVYRGPLERATFETRNPFSEDLRGKIIGAYAEARLPDGSWMTEILLPSDIKAIRNASRAKDGPWAAFFGEMVKKSAIRRLYKTIPRHGAAGRRLAQTISVLDRYEGLSTTADAAAARVLDVARARSAGDPISEQEESKLVDVLDAIEERRPGYRERWTESLADRFDLSERPLGIALRSADYPRVLEEAKGVLDTVRKGAAA